MTRITYIYHDCFLAELQELNMVFDFWKDPNTAGESMPDFIKNADKEKPFYVFVSHHHKDHYTKRIFEWESLFPKIKFIISRDVARFARHILNPDSTYKATKPSPDNVIILGRGETYMDELIKVEAFGSTDIGNSYYITVKEGLNEEDTITFFHAGDLNAWTWRDESTDEEIRKALDDYTAVLRDIASCHQSVDYAMFPVDSRIGSDYAEGARLFVNTLDVGHFFPMHFGLGENSGEIRQRERDATALKEYANRTRGEYICLQTPYSCYAKM